MIVVTTLVLLATFLPFLPGDYDPLAGTVSASAQALGIVGLLFVPVGILWALFGSAGRDYRFGIATMAVAVIFWLLASVVALAIGRFVFAACVLASGACALAAARRRLPRLKTSAPRRAAIAGYLIAVPIGVAAVQYALVDRAVVFSRNRVMANSAPLIAAIERYRSQQGRYPESMLAVWGDYKSGVIGVERFQYERAGDAYNLVFEQISSRIGTLEFVAYNPRDEQTMTSHAAVLLEHTGRALELRRGYYAVHDAGAPHWKYFWFD